jgi:hypothetical protein
MGFVDAFFCLRIITVIVNVKTREYLVPGIFIIP